MNNTYKLATVLLEFRNLIKMYHWTTTAYPRHIATCKLVADRDAAIDGIIETYSARHGRPIGTAVNLPMFNISDAEALAALERFATFLVEQMPKFIAPQDVDIQNKRDDLLAIIHQNMYLFTFK